MKEYRICIVEKIIKYGEISFRAESEEQALELAQQAYQNGEVEMEFDDLDNIQIDMTVYDY